MILLFVYLTLLIIIGLIDLKKVKNFEDFAVAGRKQKSSFVAMSILATTIGASATMGIASLAAANGFAAFLWLGSGAIALILQSLLISKKVRALNVHTLPELAEVTAGKEGKTIIALVIIISWTGIIAAQFVALSSIIALLTGKEVGTLLLIICSMVVIIYTAFGGQFSIIRTDVIQLLLVIAGIALALYSVLFNSQEINIAAIINYQGEKEISFINVLYLIFIIGGAFFIGPDVFSRNFTAKSPEAAKKAAFNAGIGLLFFSAVITLIGVAAGIINPAHGENPFIYIIKNLTHPAIGCIIGFGLLSAIISSTDTCIVTVSAIVERDILGKQRLFSARIIAILIGIISLFLALFRQDILSLLSGAYSVFSPGVVFPVFIAIMAKNKITLKKPIWLFAIITGGTFGIISNITGKEYFSLIGMSLSILISVLSILPDLYQNKKRPQTEPGINI